VLTTRFENTHPIYSIFLKNTYDFGVFCFSIRKQQQNRLLSANVAALILQSCHHCVSHDEANSVRHVPQCLNGSFCNGTTVCFVLLLALSLEIH